MKKLILLPALLAFFSSIQAQQVLPVSFINEQRESFTSQVTSTPDSTNGMDTIFNAQNEIAPASETGRNFPSKVVIYGITSTEALQFDQLSAAGSFSAGIAINRRLFTNLSFNFGTQLKKERADSVPLSLFYFPDIANTSIAFSADCNVAGNAENIFAITFQTSLQRRMIEKDSLSYDFGIWNFNVGPTYKWLYSTGNHQYGLTVGAGYNYVSINRNNTDAFNSLFNDYKPTPEAAIKHYFSGISGMISFQIDKVLLFGRIYNDLGQRHDMAFTVGIKSYLTFTPGT